MHRRRVAKIGRERTQQRRDVSALDRRGQFSAEQNHRPCDIYPDQEDWQRRERAVNCAIVRNPYLEAHVSPLRELKKHRRNERTNQRGPVPDLGVRKKNEQKKETGPYE